MKALSRKIMAIALALIMTLTILPLGAQPAYALGDMGRAGFLPTVSLGTDHCAAISANGDIYTWGMNIDGQLGLGDSGFGTNRLTPTKAAINGTWSTEEAARAALKVTYNKPVTWLKFNSPSLEFTRLIWKPGEGLLLETGTYKNLSDSKIVLENIVGTFYDANGKIVFEDEPRAGGMEMLVVDVDENNTNIMFVHNVGRMYKTPR